MSGTLVSEMSATPHESGHRVHHIVSLDIAQVRSHGQAQACPRELLGEWKGAVAPTTVSVRFGPMWWDRIVQERSNPVRGEVCSQVVAPAVPHDEQVPDGFTLCGHGGGDQTVETPQSGEGTRGQLTAAGIPGIEPPELCPPGRRLEGIQPRS